MKREELKKNESWDLSPLYEDAKKWSHAFKQISSDSLWQKLSSFKKTLNVGDEAAVCECLGTLFSLSKQIESLYTWAHLKSDEDTKNSENMGTLQQAQGLFHKFIQESSWLEPSLLALPEKTLKSAQEKYPQYKHYLDTLLHQKKHVLSEKEEGIIALSGLAISSSGKTFSALNNADLRFDDAVDSKGNKHPLTHGTYSLYLKNEDRALRKSAYLHLHKKFKEHENTCAELLLGQARTHHFLSEAKGYPSTLDAALYPKNIPVAIYHNLVESIGEELDALHEYVEFKKTLLNQQELAPYDLQYSPYSVNTSYTYEEAVTLVVESATPMGEEYKEILRAGLQKERWVDPFETENKRSGAYSSGCFGSYPYILMNFHGTLRDVYTLAHEAGHSMHSYFARKTQPYHYADYTIFLAEIASTFQEHLLTEHLLKNISSKEEKKALMLERLEDIRATLFRQVQFAEFELFFHSLAEKNEPFTASLLSSHYRKLNEKYYGKHLFLPEDSDAEWARIPHFYTNYYVYQYATGIAASLAFLKNLKEKPSKTKEKYLSFLKAGSSDWSIATLQKAGLNMESPQVIKDAVTEFRTLLEQVRNL